MTGILASKVLSLLAFILEEHNLDAVVVHGARGQVVIGRRRQNVAAGPIPSLAAVQSWQSS